MYAIDRNMRRKLAERSWVILGSVSLLLGIEGCAVSYDTTNTPDRHRTIGLTQAFQRSLIDAVVPARLGQSVAVETTGLTADQPYANALIERWLTRKGSLCRRTRTEKKRW